MNWNVLPMTNMVLLACQWWFCGWRFPGGFDGSSRALADWRYLLKLLWWWRHHVIQTPSSWRPPVSRSFDFEYYFWYRKGSQIHREASYRNFCNGSGAKPGTSPVTCGRCHGSGVINVDTQTPLGMMRRRVECPSWPRSRNQRSSVQPVMEPVAKNKPIAYT